MTEKTITVNQAQHARRLYETEQTYRKLLQHSPGNKKILLALAKVCYEQKKIPESIETLQQIVRIDPDEPGVHSHLAAMFMQIGRPKDAAWHYREILRLSPGHPQALVGMGVACMRSSQYMTAIGYFEKAIAVNETSVAAHYNLGLTRMRVGQAVEAHECFRKVLRLNPGHVEAASCLLLNLHNIEDLGNEQVLAAHVEWAAQHAHLPPAPGSHRHADRPAGAPVRIGYVSPDFRRHSVAYFILPVLEAHDRSAVESFCYSNVADPDDVTSRIRQLADNWRDISTLDDDSLISLVQEDGIDILVDLSGHTAGNRLPVFARKPAGIQVSWIGYPDTTGLPAMDYRISDGRADPDDGPGAYHLERIVRLEPCFLCYQALDDAEPRRVLPALRKGHVTFGSFNNLAKLTGSMISVWCGILQENPGSRLLLKARGLGDTGVQDFVRASFSDRGISTDRIECVGHIADTKKHLELYNDIDIALDTYPYNGTTTTCEALWMGVPVVTLAGDRHASRVGLSLLHAAGLREYAATSPLDYISIASGLAQDLDHLARLRGQLADKVRSSALANRRLVTKDLERAYRRMLAGCGG